MFQRHSVIVGNFFIALLEYENGDEKAFPIRDRKSAERFVKNSLKSQEGKPKKNKIQNARVIPTKGLLHIDLDNREEG